MAPPSPTPGPTGPPATPATDSSSSDSGDCSTTDRHSGAPRGRHPPTPSDAETPRQDPTTPRPSVAAPHQRMFAHPDGLRRSPLPLRPRTYGRLSADRPRRPRARSAALPPVLVPHVPRDPKRERQTKRTRQVMASQSWTARPSSRSAPPSYQGRRKCYGFNLDQAVTPRMRKGSSPVYGLREPGTWRHHMPERRQELVTRDPPHGGRSAPPTT